MILVLVIADNQDHLLHGQVLSTGHRAIILAFERDDFAVFAFPFTSEHGSMHVVDPNAVVLLLRVVVTGKAHSAICLSVGGFLIVSVIRRTRGTVADNYVAFTLYLFRRFSSASVSCIYSDAIFWSRGSARPRQEGYLAAAIALCRHSRPCSRRSRPSHYLKGDGLARFGVLWFCI
jgi:hypothetical protein